MKTLLTILVLITIISCRKENETVLPMITTLGNTINEGNSENKAEINFLLVKVPDREVSFTISTEDGTAKAGEDYTPIREMKVIIPAGEVHKKVEIVIHGNQNLDFNRTFSVKLKNAINAVIKDSTVTIFIKDDDTYSPSSDADGVITPDTYPGMRLVWSDEFSGNQLNANFWKYEKGAGGWGNNELEEYTDSPENVFIENGRLNIRALKDANGKYTSGRIITSGKKEFTYGRIDIRAKMPVGKGIWPALWMLGSNISSVGWPACGEIDIMEYLGHESTKVYGTAHYDENGHKSKGDSYILSSGNFNEKFHVFTLMWQDFTMVWYVDYHKYFEFNSYYPFNNPFFFIMNVAVGGNWPGNPDNTTTFPQTMVVDYVRVFQ